MINEDIASSIFKLKFKWAPFQNADSLCVGSILDTLVANSYVNEKMQNECELNKPVHIWGSGLMYSYENIKQSSVRPFIIHALRGEKTRKNYRKFVEKIFPVF